MIISCMLPKIWSMTDNFLSFWVIFCPFTPLLIPKINICKKMYKKPADIILLHMCTINEDHMMSGFWNIRHDRQSFLSFWAIFCPLTLLTTWKIKILKKMKKKKILEILSFYNCVPQMKIIWCMVHETWTAADIFFVILGHFLPFSTTNNLENPNFCKTENNSWRKVYKKSWSYAILFLRYGMPQMVIVISHFGLVFAILPHWEPQN